MHLGQIGEEVNLVADVELVVGIDSGDELVVGGAHEEVDFRAQGLNDFDIRRNGVLHTGGGLQLEVFGADTEQNLLADVRLEGIALNAVDGEAEGARSEERV